MRILTLAVLAATGSAVLTLPAAAVSASPVAGIASLPTMITSVRMKRHRKKRAMMSNSQMMKPGASGVNNKTPGAPAGSGGGNGVTGSNAAPSGK